MGKLFALFLLAAAFSNVEGHGGLIIPLTWMDVDKIGDDVAKYGLNGCSVDPKDGMLWYGKPMDSIAKHTDKIIEGQYDKEKLMGRYSTPNCYYLFLNDNSKWPSYTGNTRAGSTKSQRDLLRKTFGKNIPRMRREMFIHKINGTIPSNPHYAFAAEKADECSGYDLADDGKLELYARRCYYPWNRPGFTMRTKGGYKFTPCGVSGGLPGAVKAPYGQRAELYSYPNAAKTTWIRGKKARVVWNPHANHAGGYSYRLCKVGKTGIAGLTEECFQKTPLDFVGDQRVRSEATNDWVTRKPDDSNIGTWPVGSTWRKNHYFSVEQCKGNAKCEKICWSKGKGKDREQQCRGSIEDYVMVPKKLTPGNYVLSWRWDAEASGQIWNGCSNIIVKTK